MQRPRSQAASALVIRVSSRYRNSGLQTPRNATKMTSKTVLVTGATGLLGREVLRAFNRADWTAKGTGLSRADGSSILKVDLGNPGEVETVLDSVK